MIRLTDVSKSYQLEQRRIQILDRVSLEVGAGEHLAIMGPSGAGKSTLLNLLGCLDTIDSGHYELGGRDISTLSEDELDRLRQQHIGFVFQSAQFIDYLDLLDNVGMPGFHRGMERSQCRQRARRLLDLVGLGQRENHLPGQLSGGECQRAALARALFNSPRVLLADEPTGNLDSSNSRQLVELLSGLNREGLTVVLITHDREVAGSARRTLYLRDGRLSEGLPVS